MESDKRQMAHLTEVVPNSLSRSVVWAGLSLTGIILAGLAGLRAVMPGADIPIALGALVFVWLMLMVWFDLDQFRLPDMLTLPFIGAGLLYACLHDTSLVSAISGAVAGYSFVWTLAAIWRRWRRVEAIGMGDAKLLAAGGAWVGIMGLPFILLIASGTGLLAAIATARGSFSSGMIPFGPFLVIGIWCTWLFSQYLTVV